MNTIQPNNEWIAELQSANTMKHWLLTSTEGAIASADGTKDLLDLADTALDWVQYLDVSDAVKDKASQVQDGLEPVNKGLAVFGFIDGCNKLRRGATDFLQSDDPNETGKFFQTAMGTTCSGAESAMFLDAIDVVPLGEGLKACKQVFWSAALLADSVGFFFDIGEADKLSKQIEETNLPRVQALLEDKLALTHLKILQKVTLIALASLMLVSLTFAAVASHIVFSPVIALGLSTLWIVLQFVNYYYEQSIESREKLSYLLVSKE